MAEELYNSVQLKTIRSLIKKKIPYIILKYKLFLVGSTTNSVTSYELCTLTRGGNLRPKVLDTLTAKYAIKNFKIPVIFKLDELNEIYGDERFKDIYKSKKQN